MLKQKNIKGQNPLFAMLNSKIDIPFKRFAKLVTLKLLDSEVIGDNENKLLEFILNSASI